MNMRSITQIIAAGLVGLAITIGVAVGAPHLAAPPETVMGAQTDLGPLLVASMDDWESRV